MADTFNINDFRSSIKTSYHRASHFDVELGVPTGLNQNVGEFGPQFYETGKRLHFDIEATNIPGVAFGTEENRRYGIGPFNLKPYVPIYDTVNITVRSDSEGKIYDFFQSWMKLVINFDARRSIDQSAGFGNSMMTVAAGYEVSYKSDYVTEADIRVYDEGGGDPSIKLSLKDCYPIHLGNASLDWGDTKLLKFPITLTFSSWYQGKEIRSPVSAVDLPPLPPRT